MRRIFNWIDNSGRKPKKYRDISTTPKMMHLLENIIETPEQANDFLEAYRRVCENADYNIGYFAGLISDSDLREDVLELFGVEEQVSPRQMLDPDYRWGSTWQPPAEVNKSGRIRKGSKRS